MNPETEHATEEVPAKSMFGPQDWLHLATANDFPVPYRMRWQPLRLGIVNLWEYDQADFWFADGRMVLRGGNGAGKTKVLELTTLMLLRGEVTPSILDPFASNSRRMEHNLLPSNQEGDPRLPADSGLGYAWVEFARLLDNGETEYFTAGLGASVRRGAGSGGVQTWQFTTSLRIGIELDLCSGNRPCEAKALRQFPGVAVYESARSYRRELARHLFSMTDSAYDNLTQLLRVLRKPKLGEQLTTGELAQILRQALPPLASGEVTALGEGWTSLEQLRETTENLEKSGEVVATFIVAAWRPWARTEVRLRAQGLLENSTRSEEAGQELQAAKEHSEERQQVAERVGRELKQSRDDLTRVSTEISELSNSAAYRDVVAREQRIATLLNVQNQAVNKAQESQADLQRAQEQLQASETDVESAATAVDVENGNQADELAKLAELASNTGLTAELGQLAPSQNLAQLRAVAQRRVQRCGQAQARAKSADVAAAKVQTVQEKEISCEQNLRAAVAKTDAAQRNLTQRVEDFGASLRSWAQSWPVLAVSADQVEQWCDELSVATAVFEISELAAAEEYSGRADLDRLAAAISAFVGRKQEQFRSSAKEFELQWAPLESRRQQLRTQLKLAQETREPVPSAPQLWLRRERPAASAQLGAPLWRCVEPRENLAGEQLDLIEAALSASGLLDAWISRAGRVVEVSGEVLLIAGAACSGPTLAQILRPTPSGGVETEAIDAVLASIRWLPKASPAAAEVGTAWLAADGSWGMGQLAGQALAHGPAQFLGSTARESARQRRIEKLKEELGEVEAELRPVEEKLRQVNEALVAAENARGAIPPASEMVSVLAIWSAAQEDREVSQEALKQAKTQVREAQRRLDDARRELLAYLSERQFADRDLAQVAQDLLEFKQRIEAWEKALAALVRAESTFKSAVNRRDRDAQESARCDQRHEISRRNLGEVEDKLRIARESVDATAEQLMRRKIELETKLGELEEQITLLEREEKDNIKAVAELSAGVTVRAEQYAQAQAARDHSVAAWWSVYDGGLAGEVGEAEPEARTDVAAVAAARKVCEAQPESVTQLDLKRAWERCRAGLDTLREGLQLLGNVELIVPETELATYRIEIQLESQSTGLHPVEAGNSLAARVEEQRQLHNAEQEKMMTNLLGSTFIEHLKQRLDLTEETFHRINRHLANHPTRYGEHLRIDWSAQADGQGADIVINALRQGFDLLPAQIQETIRDFLMERIRRVEETAESSGLNWREQLEYALDYRQWLKISLQYRAGATGKWKAFDSVAHNAKSGGEKVVLLSQPLFAAAAVAYDSAGPQAPRWVFLDEAMTGVDAAFKPSFLELTVKFDLDIMLTAHDEWCTYPTVPAVAIYELARQRDVAGVGVSTFLWCGGHRTEVEVEQLGAPKPADLVIEGGLFEGLNE